MPLPHRLRPRDAVITACWVLGWVGVFLLAALIGGWRFGVGVALFAAFTALAVSAAADWFTARRREYLNRVGGR